MVARAAMTAAAPVQRKTIRLTIIAVGVRRPLGLLRLLLRGLTFWLPMVPGLWLARREIEPG